MTYGLRIINDDSELLVDSEYFSPAYVQKLEFNTTPISQEASNSYLHSGYIKREYTTPAITATGSFIVMWTLPDNGVNDVYYTFDSSVVNLNGYLTCYVYANSTGSPITYTLPTAYLFATSTLPDSTGPALRMYSSTNVKTFDSNNLQLAPYSISDAFSFPIFNSTTNYGTNPTSISLSVPENPIYMLPDYNALRIVKPSGFSEHEEFVYHAGFKRVGSTVYTRYFTYYYSFEDYGWPYTTTLYTSGRSTDLSIIVANADIYSASGGGSGGGANPTYSLSANYTSRNEGQTVVVTLTTTLIADGTIVPYTVTGIAAADLSSGGMTGTFNITSNTATASFTFDNDSTTEGEEIFVLSLDGMSQNVQVTVQDTSIGAASYSFSTPSQINENTTASNTFTALNASGSTITFEVVSPTAGYLDGSGDVTLNTTSFSPTSNNASIGVSYSVPPDSTTEGTEYFRLQASIGTTVIKTSDNISIGDTSIGAAAYGIVAADAPWAESSTQYADIAVDNYSGNYVYLTTNNTKVTPALSSLYINSNYYTNTVSYTVGDVTATTNVTLQLRTGSAAGTIQDSDVVSVVNTPPAPTYTLYNTFSSMANGVSASFYLRSTNASGVTVTVSENSARTSLDITSFTISSNTTTDTYIEITSTIPTTSQPAVTVTVTLSTGNSFSFTLQAYSLTAPLITAVSYSTAPVAAGDNKFVTITFDGPITPDLYVRIQVATGAYGTGNNVFVGGDPQLPIGASQGNYTSPDNPGLYQTTMRISARTETNMGVVRQTYVNGPLVTLLPTGGGGGAIP